MTEFRKSRQLIQIIVSNSEERSRRVFIEVPGYLYYEEIYNQDLFVHHNVKFNKDKQQHQMLSTWTVSEPRTGLSIYTSIASLTRKKAIAQAKSRLLQIDRGQYSEAMLLGMANAPERKPRWRFPTVKSAAVKVKA